MEILNNGKAYRACISLEEYPWARTEKPKLDGIGRWAYHICRGVDEQVLGGNLVLQTFVSTGNERVILVIPRTGVEEEFLRQTIDGVDNYVKGLDEPKSCLIDPKTGYTPVEASSDFDDFINW